MTAPIRAAAGEPGARRGNCAWVCLPPHKSSESCAVRNPATAILRMGRLRPGGVTCRVTWAFSGRTEFEPRLSGPRAHALSRYVTSGYMSQGEGSRPPPPRPRGRGRVLRPATGSRPLLQQLWHRASWDRLNPLAHGRSRAAPRGPLRQTRKLMASASQHRSSLLRTRPVWLPPFASSLAARFYGQL